MLVAGGLMMVLASACGGEPTTSPAVTVSVTASPSPTPSPTPTSSPAPTTIQEALKAVTPAVAKVTVSTWHLNFDEYSSCNIKAGTAFAVSPTLLVTAAHVVSGRDRTRVTWQGTTQPGTVLGYDDTKDVALIQVPGPMPGVLRWRDAPAQVGEVVATYGFAGGQSGTFFEGNVNRVNQKVQVDDTFMTGLIEMDAEFRAGNSGGPIFDSSGQVVGIVDAVLESTPAGGRLAVPATAARPLVEIWSTRTAGDTGGMTRCEALPGEVESVSADAPTYSPAIHSAAMTFVTYVNAINGGDYVTAHAQLADGGDLKKFTEAVTTSQVEAIDYDALNGPDNPVIDVSFSSRQEAGKGPRGRPDETCTLWHNRYTFTPKNDLWLIAKSLSQPGRPQNEPCPTASPSGPQADLGD